jgi:hypothetical protein
MDGMGDHLCTCTVHSGVKKALDWVVEQLVDLFHVTHHTNTQHVTKSRGRRADYNNNPPNVVSFMFAIVSTSGRLHSEFIRLLFLQVHRETDLFFTASGVQVP